MIKQNITRGLRRGRLILVSINQASPKGVNYVNIVLIVVLLVIMSLILNTVTIVIIILSIQILVKEQIIQYSH